MYNASFVNLTMIESDLSTLFTRDEHDLNDYILFDFEFNNRLYVFSGLVIGKEKMNNQFLYFIEVFDMNADLLDNIERYENSIKNGVIN
ncbi:MAG: hypothetical protein U9Q80_00080 [Bacillota bacterium]|nr:hypothetical protein [Bacillota bacterium]